MNDFVKTIESTIEYIDDGVIEGGDVVVDNVTIYTGISERTNIKGCEWLNKTPKHKYNIVPINLKESFLHLDVVFTIILDEHAIVYSPGIETDNLIKAQIFLINIEDFSKITKIRNEYFKNSQPVSTLVEVSRLVKDGC